MCYPASPGRGQKDRCPGWLGFIEPAGCRREQGRGLESGLVVVFGEIPSSMAKV